MQYSEIRNKIDRTEMDSYAKRQYLLLSLLRDNEDDDITLQQCLNICGDNPFWEIVVLERMIKPELTETDTEDLFMEIDKLITELDAYTTDRFRKFKKVRRELAIVEEKRAIYLESIDRDQAIEALKKAASLISFDPATVEVLKTEIGEMERADE